MKNRPMFTIKTAESMAALLAKIPATVAASEDCTRAIEYMRDAIAWRTDAETVAKRADINRKIKAHEDARCTRMTDKLDNYRQAYGRQHRATE